MLYSRRDLMLENFVPRQQLVVFKSERPQTEANHSGQVFQGSGTTDMDQAEEGTNCGCTRNRGSMAPRGFSAVSDLPVAPQGLPRKDMDQ